MKNIKKLKAGPKIPTIVIVIGKFLSRISTRLTVRYLARLFTTPVRYKMPKRELEMFRHSRQTKLFVPTLNQEIVVYENGSGSRKVLLVHGWSGRGTQLVKFSERLQKSGYSTVSFDAPAHGRSSGRRTLMPEFIDCIQQIDKRYGPFGAAIGHSLGGMSVLNAVRRGFSVNRVIAIGSGDIVKDIMDDFIRKMKLPGKYSMLMRDYFEESAAEKMENYDAHRAAQKITIPILVIHDRTDNEVPLDCGIHIHKHSHDGKLMVTNGLGHRKILGNEEVLEASMKFIRNDEEYETNMLNPIVVGHTRL